MKINDDLITKKLPALKMSEFKNYLKENIKIKELTPFQKFVVSSRATWSVVGAILFGLLLMVIFFMTAVFNTRPFMLFLFMSIFIFLPIGALVFFASIKKRVINDATKNLNILLLFKKWMSYYGIAEKHVAANIADQYLPLISQYRKSPNDARLFKISAAYSFIGEKAVTTSFVSVVWRWTRSSGKSRKTYYLHQTYMIDENFDSKWQTLDFKLASDNSLFSFKRVKKNETLENDSFNRKFNYNFSDPVKMRMIMTPHTQESFLTKYKYHDIAFIKENQRLITICKNQSISKDFSPFTYDVTGTKVNYKNLKAKLIEDVVTDFQYLMKIIGHARIMKNLFK